MSRRTAVCSVLCLAAGLFTVAPARAEEPPRGEPSRGEPSRGEPPSSEPETASLPLGPATSEPKYLRAALANLGALALGTAYYWLSASANARDWDFPRLSERFNEENVRFDNNTHLTNNLLHPLAGASYYGLARVNSLGVGESMVYAQVSSAIWEWMLEWREKVSINDVIMTPNGGVPLGEFLVQLAAYLNSAPGDTTWGQDVAKTTLGLPVWIYDKLDGRRPDPSPPADRLGFSSAYHHRFTTDFEQSWLDDSGEREQVLSGVSLSATLSSLRGFGKPEALDTVFANGNFTEGQLSLGFDSSGVSEAELKVAAVLAGYYVQRVNPGVTGLLVGLGTALEFVDRDTLGIRDQYGILHFLGPALGLLWKRKSYELSLAGRMYADFGAIRSLAWPLVRAAAPDDAFKSTLDESYQYHLGASSRLSAELRAGAARLTLEHGYGRYHSIDGLDRFEEDITRDIEGTETLEDRRVSLALEPSGSIARFRLGFERLSHASELGGVRADRLERRVVVGVGLAF